MLLFTFVAVALTNPPATGGVKSNTKLPLKLPLASVIAGLWPSGIGIEPIVCEPCPWQFAPKKKSRMNDWLGVLLKVTTTVKPAAWGVIELDVIDPAEGNRPAVALKVAEVRTGKF